MVTAEELGSQSFEITAISFNAGPASDPQGPYNNFSILMGHTELNSLTETFDSNWSTSGTQVLSDPTLVISGVQSGSWFTLTLDTPFEYNGTSNLLMEIVWEGPSAPPGQGSIYTWLWSTSGNRIVTSGNPVSPTGFASDYCQYMRIDYDPLAMPAGTFAEIKTFF